MGGQKKISTVMQAATDLRFLYRVHIFIANLNKAGSTPGIQRVMHCFSTSKKGGQQSKSVLNYSVKMTDKIMNEGTEILASSHSFRLKKNRYSTVQFVKKLRKLDECF